MIHYFLFKLNRLNFWFPLLTWLTSSVFIDIGSLPTSHLFWHLTKGHKPGRSRSSPADHQPPGCSQDEDQYLSQLCHGTPWNFRGIPGHPKTTQFLATRWSNTCHVDVFFLVDLTHQNGGTERFNTPGWILKMMDFTEKGKLFHHPCLVCVFLGFIWIYPYQVQKQGSYGSFNNQTWWTIAMWASKIRI